MSKIPEPIKSIKLVQQNQQKPPIDSIEFVNKFKFEMEQSDVFFKYIHKFPKEIGDEQEMIWTNNFILFLNDLCEYFYSFIGIPHIENNITIFSYATGCGFMEAYFANWLKLTNKCIYCNIVCVEPIDYFMTYSNYKIFDQILVNNNYVRTCENFEKLLTTILYRPDAPLLNIHKLNIFHVDIFISINPQNYGNLLNIIQIIKFLMLIGGMINIKTNIIGINSNPQENVIKLLNWTRNVNMLWIFIDDSFIQSPTKIDNIREYILNTSSSYYELLLDKFHKKNIASNTIGPLYNILNFLNFYLTDNEFIELSVQVFENNCIFSHKLISLTKSTESSEQIEPINLNNYKKKYLKYKNKYLKLKNQKFQ